MGRVGCRLLPTRHVLGLCRQGPAPPIESAFEMVLACVVVVDGEVSHGETVRGPRQPLDRSAHASLRHRCPKGVDRPGVAEGSCSANAQ